MVFVYALEEINDLESRLLARGIITRWSGKKSRMVLHLDVSQDDVQTVISTIAEEFQR